LNRKWWFDKKAENLAAHNGKLSRNLKIFYFEKESLDKT
jgi:hypothetical protein